MSTLALTEPAQAAKVLSAYDNFLLDCDGVIWFVFQGKPYFFPGVLNAMKALEKQGKRLFFVTNRSNYPATAFQKFFEDGGIKPPLNHIFCPPTAAALYLKDKLQIPVGSTILMVESMVEKLHESYKDGSLFEGMYNVIKEEDLEEIDYPKVSAVLVRGHGSPFPKDQLKAIDHPKSIQFLKSHPQIPCLLINPDHCFDEEFEEGTNEINNFFTEAGRRNPVVIGKPSGVMIELIQKIHNLDLKKTIMVGDNPDSDIKFGHAGGIDTMLVLSGVAKSSETNLPVKPTLAAKNLISFVDLALPSERLGWDALVTERLCFELQRPEIWAGHTHEKVEAVEKRIRNEML